MNIITTLTNQNSVDPFKIIELRAQYEVLSHIEEMFTPKSKHRVAKYVDKKMREIIKEIENLKSNTNES